jgi:hypothetical protein
VAKNFKRDSVNTQGTLDKCKANFEEYYNLFLGAEEKIHNSELDHA